jgi:hypothetical protein
MIAIAAPTTRHQPEQNQSEDFEDAHMPFPRDGAVTSAMTKQPLGIIVPKITA